jgi:tetratricopeptide (TPR) repeat protein
MGGVFSGMGWLYDSPVYTSSRTIARKGTEHLKLCRAAQALESYDAALAIILPHTPIGYDTPKITQLLRDIISQKSVALAMLGRDDEMRLVCNVGKALSSMDETKYYKNLIWVYLKAAQINLVNNKYPESQAFIDKALEEYRDTPPSASNRILYAAIEHHLGAIKYKLWEGSGGDIANTKQIDESLEHLYTAGRIYFSNPLYAKTAATIFGQATTIQVVINRQKQKQAIQVGSSAAASEQSHGPEPSGDDLEDVPIPPTFEIEPLGATSS